MESIKCFLEEGQLPVLNILNNKVYILDSEQYDLFKRNKILYKRPQYVPDKFKVLCYEALKIKGVWRVTDKSLFKFKIPINAFKDIFFVKVKTESN